MVTTAPPRRLQVLLIDDEPAACLLASMAFEPQADRAQLRTLDDPAAAIPWLHAAARAGTLPDVILLDLFMPTVSGLAILQAIQASEPLRHLRVVVLATSDDPQDIDAAYRAGATSYLTKPGVFTAFEVQVDTLVTYWHGIFDGLNP